MSVIKKSAPINVIVYYPTTPEGKAELVQRVTDVHVDIVNHKIRSLNCPTKQKLELIDAIIDTTKKRVNEHSR